jgi:thioesterase domain-containing protein
VTLFRAHERHPAVHDKRLLGWGYLALGGVEVYEIPGDHGTILQPPNLDILVDEIKSAIRVATGGQIDGNA